jgi:hypothetical protein
MQEHISIAVSFGTGMMGDLDTTQPEIASFNKLVVIDTESYPV